MIGAAIYELLNVTSVTDLVNDISPNQASRETSPPFIVYNENGTTENFKDDYQIVNYNLQIDIYAAQTNEGGGGKAKCIEIMNVVEPILHRYKGTVADVVIENIVLQNRESMFDPIAEYERIMLTYSVRVKEIRVVPISKTVITIDGEVMTIGSQVITI